VIPAFSATSHARNPKFGQFFVGEQGKVIVLEPKYTHDRDLVLYEPQPGAGVRPIGRSPMVSQWTRIIETYGPMSNKGNEGFYALVNQFRVNMLASGVLQNVPGSDKQTAIKTLTHGEAIPFNGGIRLDYKA
jgi:hypothetical protein